jgi:hypothetical protein
MMKFGGKMSVLDNYVPIRTLGNGTTKDFSGLWNALETTNLKVYLENATTGALTLQTMGTDYQAVVASTGFTVTFTTAPTASYYVVIGIDVPKTQANPYKTVKGWQGTVVEASFDKLTIIAQQFKNLLDRTLVFPLGSTGATLPSNTACANKYLAFDSTGAPTAIDGVASISTSTSTQTVGTGSKTFVLTTDALFIAGQSVLVVSAANSANYMFGTVTSYTASTDTLIVNVSSVGGSGTHADWNIGLSGPQGIKGDTGASGTGTGDMLAAQNLNDVADKPTAWTNLGGGTAGKLASVDEDDMASDSNVLLPTQQSVKAYVDGKSSVTSLGFSGLGGGWASNTTATWVANQIIVQDSSNNSKLLSAFNKTLNTATSGAGGLDTGSTAANTWYFVFAIYNGTTQNILMSTSATSPSLPSGYTYFARIGAVRLDASKNIIGFVQKNRKVSYTVGNNLAAPLTAASGTSVSFPTSVAVGAYVPSTASKINGTLFGWGLSSASHFAAVAPNASYDRDTNTPVYMYASGTTIANRVPFDMILESTNIYWGVASGSTSKLLILGWEDNL